MVQKAASTLYLCQDVCGEVSGGDGGLKLSIKLSASLHPAVVWSVGPLLTRTLRNYEDEDTTDDEEDIEEEGPELPVKDINLEKYEEKIGGRKRKRRKAKKFEDEDDNDDEEEVDDRGQA